MVKKGHEPEPLQQRSEANVPVRKDSQDQALCSEGLQYFEDLWIHAPDIRLGKQAVELIKKNIKGVWHTQRAESLSHQRMPPAPTIRLADAVTYWIVHCPNLQYLPTLTK